jgi:glucose-1-phosphate thymidylyltransferase
MKGILLCAGKGTRIQPFSLTQPKTLMPVANSTILERCIQKMAEIGIDEIAIVVSPSQQTIVDYVTKHLRHPRVTFILQNEPKGIFHALFQAKSFIDNERFVLMLGDNIIGESLESLIKAFEGNQGALLLAEVHNPQDYGVAEIHGERILRLEEKPLHPVSRLAVIGTYALDPVIFEVARDLKPSVRGEYELTDALQCMLSEGLQVSYRITDRLFADVGTVERCLETNRALLDDELNGKVVIGPDTLISNCTFIGPVIIGSRCKLTNAVIGPYVSIQDDCEVNHCQIENSILMQESSIMHIDSKITFSVLGRRVRLTDLHRSNNEIHYILGEKSEIQGEESIE